MNLNNAKYKVKRLFYSNPFYSVTSHIPGIKSFLHNPFRIQTVLDILAESEGDPIVPSVAENVCRAIEKNQPIRGKENIRFHNRLLNKAEFLARRTELSSFPTRMYIELTNACNLECPMCGQSMFKGKRDILPIEGIEKIRSLFPYLDDLCLAGFGETLIYSKLDEVLDTIPADVPTRIISNGLALTEQMIDKLTGRLNSLWISFEAVNAETYRDIRGVDGYESLLDKLRLLKEKKRLKNTSLPNLYLCFVSMHRNIEQLPSYVEQAAQLGATGVKVNFLTVFKESMVSESLFSDRQKAYRYFEEAKKMSEKYGIEITFPSEGKEQVNDFFMCSEPWSFTYLSASGNIIPCCVYTHPLGNIFEQDFIGIWNNSKYQEFRHKVNSTKERPRRCRRCIIEANRSIWDKNRHFQLIDEKNQLLEDEKRF